MTADEIFSQVKEVLVKNFELRPDQITLDSNIVTDLDLDAIDML